MAELDWKVNQVIDSDIDEIGLALLRKQYLDNPSLHTANPYQTILSLFWPADFATSKQEKKDVTKIFCRRIYRKEILPLISEQLLSRPPQFYEFAERCLVCLSLFENYFIKKNGSRAVKFYRDKAVSSLEVAKRFDIARNFDSWVSYAGDVLKSVA